ASRDAHLPTGPLIRFNRAVLEQYVEYLLVLCNVLGNLDWRNIVVEEVFDPVNKICDTHPDPKECHDGLKDGDDTGSIERALRTALECLSEFHQTRIQPRTFRGKD